MQSCVTSLQLKGEEESVPPRPWQTAEELMEDFDDFLTAAFDVANAPINVMPHLPPLGQGWGNIGDLHGDLCKCPYIGALISVQIPQGVWNNNTRTNINKHPHLLQVRPLLQKNVCSGSNMSSNSCLIASFRLS